MVRRLAVALVFLVAHQARAGGDAGRIERKLAVQQQVLESMGTGCQFLSVLSRNMPRALVLSKLTWQRVPGALEFELNEGTEEDAATLLGALSAAKLCSTVELKAPGKDSVKGLKGSCVFPASPQKRTVRSAQNLGDESLSLVRNKLDENRIRIPDVAKADELEASLREVAARWSVSELTVVPSTPKTRGPVDVISFILHGRASSVAAFSAACELGRSKRLVSIESMEFAAPRPDKAEWSVEFTFGVQSWRYRTEDEATRSSRR